MEESTYEKEMLDWLESRNFTTLFVDGNHENYTRLYNYPVEEWKGGNVHKIRNSVLHLMRGEVFDIDNKKFFVFGGARSHDIQDGILNLDEEEKIYEYRKRGAFFRIRDFLWWDLELPTNEEMENGIKNLEKESFCGAMLVERGSIFLFMTNFDIAFNNMNNIFFTIVLQNNKNVAQL